MDLEGAIREGSMQVTGLLLIAAGILLLLGVGGVRASLLVVVGLLTIAVGLYLVRPSTTRLGRVSGFDVGHLVQLLWLSPLVAALALLGEPGASATEVQALGGLVGLVGMANYFLRPLYLLAYDLGQAVVDRTGGRSDGL